MTTLGSKKLVEMYRMAFEMGNAREMARIQRIAKLKRIQLLQSNRQRKPYPYAY